MTNEAAASSGFGRRIGGASRRRSRTARLPAAHRLSERPLLRHRRPSAAGLSRGPQVRWLCRRPERHRRRALGRWPLQPGPRHDGRAGGHQAQRDRRGRRQSGGPGRQGRPRPSRWCSAPAPTPSRSAWSAISTGRARTHRHYAMGLELDAKRLDLLPGWCPPPSVAHQPDQPRRRRLQSAHPRPSSA